MVKVLILILFLTPFASAEPFFELPGISKGEVRDKAERRHLFNYTRTVKEETGRTLVKREFLDLEGQLVASETVTYRDGRAVRMDLDQKQTDERGFFEIKGDQIHFEFTSDGKTKTDQEKLEANTVWADEVVPFLYKNWAQINKGETLSIRFPVVPRRETVGFKFFKDREDGQAIYIKMKPSSLVIAALVKPLIFKFKKDGDFRLIEVDGRVTPKQKVGSSWKDLDALLVLTH